MTDCEENVWLGSPAISSVGFNPGPYILDRFTGDGVALDAHTPDINVAGGGWSYDDGSVFTIVANELSIGPERNRAVIDAGEPNVKVTGSVTIPGDDNFFIALRWADANNWIRCGFDYIPFGSIGILEFVGGVPNLLGSLVTGDFGAQSWDFEVTIVGNAVTMKDLTNGTEISGTSDVALAANTFVGLGDGGAESGPEIVDDFLVERP